MAKTPEGEVKDLVKKFCKAHGIWYVMIVPSAYGRSTGVSDFQILHKGMFIVIETKRGDKPSDPTPNQVNYMSNVIANGGYAFVVRNENDLEPIRALISSVE